MLRFRAAVILSVLSVSVAFAQNPPKVPDTVSFEPGTRAASVYGAEHATNSVHRQAVDRAGSEIAITGRAPDGIVEAIEHRMQNALGVQWHPECHTALDPALMWIVDEATRSAR